MSMYYVNKNAQPNGDHEVHKEPCFWLPAPENRDYLGIFNSCRDAVNAARKDYTSVDGCVHCCPDCHNH